MKKIYLIVVLLCVLACNIFSPKKEFRFVYGFINDNEITNFDVIQTIEVLENRLNIYGVEHKINRFGENNVEIIIIKADTLDDKRVNNLITNPGKLEFWPLFEADKFTSYIIDIDLQHNKGKETDSVLTKSLFDLVINEKYQQSSVLFYAKKEDTATISKLMNSKAARLNLDFQHRNVKYLWGVPNEKNYLPLYATKSNLENKAPLTGSYVTKAVHTFGYSGRPEISIEMDQRGAVIWEKMTEEAYQNQSKIAITVNNLVYSAPGVVNGSIKGGKSSISGDFTLNEAKDLAIIFSENRSIPKLELLEFSSVESR